MRQGSPATSLEQPFCLLTLEALEHRHRSGFVVFHPKPTFACDTVKPTLVHISLEPDFRFFSLGDVVFAGTVLKPSGVVAYGASVEVDYERLGLDVMGPAILN